MTKQLTTEVDRKNSNISHHDMGCATKGNGTNNLILTINILKIFALEKKMCNPGKKKENRTEKKEQPTSPERNIMELSE